MTWLETWQHETGLTMSWVCGCGHTIKWAQVSVKWDQGTRNVLEDCQDILRCKQLISSQAGTWCVPCLLLAGKPRRHQDDPVPCHIAAIAKLMLRCLFHLWPEPWSRSVSLLKRRGVILPAGCSFRPHTVNIPTELLYWL